MLLNVMLSCSRGNGKLKLRAKNKAIKRTMKEDEAAIFTPASFTKIKGAIAR